MLKLNSFQTSRRPVTWGYLVAIASVVAAMIGLWLMEKEWHAPAYVALFLVAVIISAWLGGAKPALLAIALSVLAFDYLFLRPVGSPVVASIQEVRLLSFAVVAAYVVWVTFTERNTAESLLRARDELHRNNETLRDSERKLKEAERLANRSSLKDYGGQAGQGLLAEMMRTRKPAVTNDALNDSRVVLKHAMAEVGINSAAFLPLAVGDRVAGVMAMYSPVRGHFDDAEVKLLSDLAADISFALEHLEKSERVAYLALYDELTGLANRRLLTERLEQFVHAAGRAQDKLAVALLDIERLRSVNESLGRRAGDALLRQVAERLTEAAAPGAVARIA